MGEVQVSVRLLQCTPNAEELVAMAAKLCYSDAGIEELAQGVSSRDQSKFLARLMEMGHLSPIEHASFTFGVEGVSRSLLAQLTRHRIASFSVKSQRYVGAISKEGEGFSYIVPQGIQNKGQEAIERFKGQMDQIQMWYDQWVEELGEGESGYEDARFVLPNAAETKLVVTMNARELLHFFNIRCCNRAQWEIREMAWQMLKIVKEVAPTLFAQAGPGCIGGPCPEGHKTCGKQKEIKDRYNQMFGGEKA